MNYLLGKWNRLVDYTNSTKGNIIFGSLILLTETYNVYSGKSTGSMIGTLIMMTLTISASYLVILSIFKLREKKEKVND